MKVFLKEIEYFFLTTRKNLKRVENITNLFKDYNLTEFNPGLDCEKNKSGAADMSRMVDLGLRYQIPGEPFKPFVILEDDVSLFRPMPDFLEIPEDADMFFIGIADSVMLAHTNISCSGDIYATDYDENVVRIFNMLDTHAVMITSPAGAAAFQRCMMEAYYRNMPWDIFTARIQPFYKVYALKIPLLYQDGKLGGLEGQTKIILNKYVNPPKPYTENVSIKMACNAYNHEKVYDEKKC